MCALHKSTKHLCAALVLGWSAVRLSSGGILPNKMLGGSAGFSKQCSNRDNSGFHMACRFVGGIGVLTRAP